MKGDEEQKQEQEEQEKRREEVNRVWRRRTQSDQGREAEN